MTKMRISGEAGHGDSASGFTLIELMVVLALIGIMTALIIPEMRGTYEDALLRSAGRRLVSALQLAHSRAVTLQERHRVHLDSRSGRYFVAPAGQFDATASADFRAARVVPGGEGLVDTRITIAIRAPERTEGESPDDHADEPVELEPQGPAGADAIAFYPDGTADDAEILLRDRAGFRLALRINPITARVEVGELGRE